MAHVINQISPFTPYMAHLFQRGELSLKIILNLMRNAPPFEKGRLGVMPPSPQPSPQPSPTGEGVQRQIEALQIIDISTVSPLLFKERLGEVLCSPSQGEHRYLHKYLRNIYWRNM